MTHLGSIVGRGGELAELRRCLDSQPLVTVLGTAGVGKTRLVLELAASWAGRVVICQVADARTDDELLALVAAGLGIPLESPSADAGYRQLGTALAADPNPLLVLDTVDRALGPVRDALTCWMSAAPAARFVATSRTPVGLGAERRLELLPLGEADAVALFEDRVGRVRPTAMLPEERAQGREIARLVEGLPLAIELAAARAAVMSLPELRVRLEDRFEVLRRPVDVGRHTTLEAALDWSWELLEPAERDALAQCSVFRREFTLAAAERVVVVAGRRVVDLLHVLRERSMLTARPLTGGALGLGLLDAVREHVERQGETVDRIGPARHRHARYWLAVADEVADAPERVFLRLPSEGECENLVAAFRHLEAIDPAGAVRVALAVTTIRQARGAFDIPILDDAVAAAERLGDALLLARVRLARGLARHRWTHMPEALDDAHGTVLPPNAGPPVIAEREYLLGTIANETGQLPEAVEHLSRAVALLEPTSGSWFYRSASIQLASVEWSLGGSVEAAIRRLEQALTLARDHGDVYTEGRVLAQLGSRLASAERFAEARPLLERSLRMHVSHGHQRGEAITRLYLGVIGVELEDPHGDTEGHLVRAIALMGELGIRRGHPMALLGVLHHQRRDLDGAERWLRSALETVADPRGRGMTLAHLGAVQAARGATIEASHSFAEARTLLEALDPPIVGPLVLLEGLLDLHAVEPRPEEARRRLAAVPTDSLQTRLCAALLRRALAALTPSALHVARDGTWFGWAGQPRVTVARRRALTRILEALVSAHAADPQRGVTTAELTAIGWPDDRPRGESGAMRAWTAVATLRREGLRDAIVRVGAGYGLSPDLAITRHD